jgi:hypothetical protein
MKSVKSLKPQAEPSRARYDSHPTTPQISSTRGSPSRRNAARVRARAPEAELNHEHHYLDAVFPLARVICPTNAPGCRCRPCQQRRARRKWYHVLRYSKRTRGDWTSTAIAARWNQDRRNQHDPMTPAYVRRIKQMMHLDPGARLDGKPRAFGKPGRPKKFLSA